VLRAEKTKGYEMPRTEKQRVAKCRALKKQELRNAALRKFRECGFLCAFGAAQGAFLERSVDFGHALH
jgi:hypothetical protein